MTSRQNQCHKQLVRIGAPIVKYERKPFYGENKQTDAALRNAWRSGGGSKQLSDSFVTELIKTLQRVESDLEAKDTEIALLKDQQLARIGVQFYDSRETDNPRDREYSIPYYTIDVAKIPRADHWGKSTEHKLQNDLLTEWFKIETLVAAFNAQCANAYNGQFS
tara:strand:+ start:357 stop:848 length:492 start_codon:yes stop_codon:yes gene_type:complete